MNKISVYLLALGLSISLQSTMFAMIQPRELEIKERKAALANVYLGHINNLLSALEHNPLFSDLYQYYKELEQSFLDNYFNTNQIPDEAFINSMRGFYQAVANAQEKHGRMSLEDFTHYGNLKIAANTLIEFAYAFKRLLI